MSEQRPLRNAVEIDDWLNDVTDEEWEQLQANKDVAYRDQLDAAARKAKEIEETILGNKTEWIPRNDVVAWVRLGMYDVLSKWFQGQLRLCIHQPNPARPEPVFAAAWKPGVLVCEQCMILLGVTGIADKTCDGCGHICEGPPDDGITPVTTFVSSLGYQVGVCDSCHAEMRRAEASG